jgi:RNA 2',3'-cyclic 3'-phosphodiesterase
MIRTFLAVDFDEAFLDEVAALAERLRGAPRLSAARWAARDTLHTTLRFFGDTSDAQVAALRTFVKEVAAGTGSFAVRAPWVHGFPARARAHVLVLDVAAGELASLATRAEALAVRLGFAAETRPYHAHLTLARMRKPVDVSALAAEAASLPLGRVTAVTLYASSSSPDGAVYTALERATLA